MTSHGVAQPRDCPETSMALLLLGESGNLRPQGYYDAADALGISFRGVSQARWLAVDEGLLARDYTRLNDTVTEAGREALDELPESIHQSVKELLASMIDPASNHRPHA